MDYGDAIESVYRGVATPFRISDPSNRLAPPVPTL